MIRVNGKRIGLAALTVVLSLATLGSSLASGEGTAPEAAQSAKASAAAGQAGAGKQAGLAQQSPPMAGKSEADRESAGRSFEPSYMEMLEQWKQQGIQEGTGSIVIEGRQFVRQSEHGAARVESYGGRDQVLVWNNKGTNWIEYEVRVDQPGLYEMVMEYHSYNDPSSNVTRYRPAILSVAVNGQHPFKEARAIKFPRRFKDTLPLQKDSNGDHIRPKPIELEDWVEQSFRDTEGAYAEPLRWYLEKGTHTLRLQSYESIVIDKIRLKQPETPLPYAEAVKNMTEGKGGASFVVEAEEMAEKNDVALQMDSDQDARMTPFADNKRIFNAVGGQRWSTGWAGATWKFNVPESGRYKIAVRAYQGYLSNQKVFRKILIDGKTPFQELLAYPFPYSNGWQGVVLQNEEKEAFTFYFEKGEHTLSMETTYDPFHAIVKRQEQISQSLTLLSLDLNAIIGGQTDQYRTWNIKDHYPDLLNQLQAASDEINWMAGELLRINGREDNNSQILATAARDMKDLVDSPNDIPYRLDDLKSIQNKISSIRSPLTSAPLMVDKFYFMPVQEDFPRMKATGWQKLRTSVKSFLHSFSAKDRLSYGDKGVVNVWANYGRDYINVLQDMADQYFTPATGIKVKVDLLPREQLLVLSNAAGKAPDVAIGITEGRPIEMAIRGAVEDLSQYPGFQEVFQQYSPGATLPYYYDGGYYAFPETQRFNILYFRKDILDVLGLKVPQTWEDVIAMLPVLQQNNYNFYLPADFQTFMYQNGAEFYTKDGMRTELDSPGAFQAFRQLTDMFTIYGIDQQVSSFYQHFRDGTMPIGIADFNLYLQLAVAAPELHGWWGIAEMPGIADASGEIARWTGGNQSAAMIFEKSVNKDEGWQFMQWWLSAETQQRFGSDLEGFYGTAFRWNTANVEAFSNLPWSKEELNVLLRQWRWYKDIANLPGSYFITRELNNAWSRTVLNGMNYRESLEEAVVNVNRELERKAREFGYIADDGTVLKTYNPPRVTKPWEGVDAFANE